VKKKNYYFFKRLCGTQFYTASKKIALLIVDTPPSHKEKARDLQSLGCGKS
jgi:hypothetical protein